MVSASPSPSWRLLGPRSLAALVAMCWLLLPSVALAATSSEEAESTTSDDEASVPAETEPPTNDDEQSITPVTATIEVTATPLVGDGRDDGDLVVVDEDAGSVALFFSPTAPAEQRAVHELRVRNTGDTPLSAVEVTDDQMGTVLAASEGTTLAPGEELVTQAEMTFTFDEVSTGRAGLVLSTTTASGTAEDGTVVSDSAETRVELVAVLSESGLDAPEIPDGAAEDAPATDAAVEVEDEGELAATELPETGLDAPTALSLSAAFLVAGALLLVVSRPRTAAAARPRRRPAVASRRRG